ncbi:hypothetical protein T05_1205 [Trichinella murrelli]|uniref:Uncharacterized protein n=1 Tax=Trichinella murrelli TaxID=144512 RepID=A0A0V0U0X8_9BILA|nr:hypothetical protein T05_1205 [Trichinella murrelli]
MEQGKSEITDGMKQNKRTEEINANNTSKGEVILKYFRIRARHEAEQEKTKFLDPNSVSLGLGYFKRWLIKV